MVRRRADADLSPQPKGGWRGTDKSGDNMQGNGGVYAAQEAHGGDATGLVPRR